MFHFKLILQVLQIAKFKWWMLLFFLKETLRIRKFSITNILTTQNNMQIVLQT